MKIVVCTTTAKCLSMLIASVSEYATKHMLFISAPPTLRAPLEASVRGVIYHDNVSTNFGDAYNDALNDVFKTDRECIIANDDVVLNPDTMELMLSDVADISYTNAKNGLVGARSNFVLPSQNIRFPSADDKIVLLRYASEMRVKEASVIAPIFAYISREAFQAAKFPPLNWYSDNVLCEDLKAKGFRHFVSRAYVHHVGSQTCGELTQENVNRLTEEAKPWIREHRPEYYKRWFGQ